MRLLLDQRIVTLLSD